MDEWEEGKLMFLEVVKGITKALEVVIPTEAPTNSSDLSDKDLQIIEVHLCRGRYHRSSTGRPGIPHEGHENSTGRQLCKPCRWGETRENGYSRHFGNGLVLRRKAASFNGLFLTGEHRIVIDPPHDS